jgi:hypothetical protein
MTIIAMSSSAEALDSKAMTDPFKFTVVNQKSVPGR